MAQSLIPFPEPSQLIWPVEDIFPFLQKNVVTDGQRRRGAITVTLSCAWKDEEGGSHWASWQTLEKAHVQSKEVHLEQLVQEPQYFQLKNKGIRAHDVQSLDSIIFHELLTVFKDHKLSLPFLVLPF